ncbi:MAG: ABC transporter permease [Lentisphaerae bacterium]|nr:ABC transporter permease [Lentisphaerota bacterium]MBE6389155.1 ABC transporter permease [Lentisphaerota bacterium]
MISYIIKRLLLAVITLTIILLVSYIMLRLAPGDPTRSDMLTGTGETVNSQSGFLTQNNSLREKLNLDKPVLTGFILWLGNILRNGDFGESATVEPGRKVTDIIAERAWFTIKLNLWAIFITYLLSIPIGVFSAARAGTLFDRSCETVLFILYSLPVMWVGLLLQAWLCEGGKFPIFPLAAMPPDPETLHLSIWEYQWQQLRHTVLPVICLTYAGFAGLSRYTRGSVLQNIHSDYIRSARAKGLSENRILWKHAFGNALITMVTLFSGILPSLIAGSVIVEYIFNLPGMGTLSLQALSSRDYPLQMALFTFAGTLTLTGILLADLLYIAVDPRIRLTK